VKHFPSLFAKVSPLHAHYGFVFTILISLSTVQAVGVGSSSPGFYTHLLTPTGHY